MVPPKRGIYFLVLLILATSVSAAHTATITSNYLQIYETTTANITLSVENSFFSTSSINNVTILPAGFHILSAISPTDWTLTAGSVINYYTATSAISSWGSQNFGLELKADKVDADQTHTWTFTTTDYAKNSATNTLQFQVLNDDTAPLLLNIIPENSSFLKEGASQLFSVDVTDPETGVESVSLVYGLCNNVTNIAALAKNSNTYSDRLSFPYSDSTVVCYRFSAVNNGGAVANYPGQLTIDGKPPVVQLSAPAENALMGNNSQFSFIAADNLAPTLNCLLYVDGRNEANTTADNNETTTIAASEAPEGTHKWAVRCSDLAGWEAASSERTFTLDKTAPNITTSLRNGVIMKAGTPVDVEVTDNYEVNQVWYEYLGQTINASESFSIDTTNGTDGENTVTIYATDSVGNLRTLEFKFIIDKLPPSIELVAPPEAATLDLHTTYFFTATDNYDPVLDCTLRVANSSTAVSVNNSATAEVSRITDVGEFKWYVECTDDADNKGTSEERSIKVIDISGPDIILAGIGTLPRGQTARISALVTDYSGVADVYAVIVDPSGNNQTINLEKDGNLYSANYLTTINSSLGDYEVIVNAADTLGNSADASDSFDLINSYIITVGISGSVKANQNVIATGTVLRDDGISLNTTIQLQTPSGTSAVDVISGSFSKTFKAPSKAGTYEVRATLSINNFTFSETAQFNVKKSGSSGGSHSGHSGIVTPGIVEPPEEEIVPDNSGIMEPKKNESKPEELNEDDQGENDNNQGENQDRNVPVGKASGIFSLDTLKSSRLLWILLLVAMLAIILLLGSGRKKDKFGLDSYLGKIRKENGL
jgi:hypothetical protein